jgi:hypothetical protein
VRGPWIAIPDIANYLSLSVFNAEYEKQMHKPAFLFEPKTEEEAAQDPAILVPFMLPTLALGGAPASASRIPSVDDNAEEEREGLLEECVHTDLVSDEMGTHSPTERSMASGGRRDSQLWSPFSNMSTVSMSHTDVLTAIALQKYDVADRCAVCSLIDRQLQAAHTGVCPRIPAANPLEELTESNMALWTQLSLCHGCFRPLGRDHLCSIDCAEEKSQFLDIIGYIFLSDDAQLRQKLQTFVPDCPELQPTDEAILFIGRNIGEVIDVLEIDM